MGNEAWSWPEPRSGSGLPLASGPAELQGCRGSSRLRSLFCFLKLPAGTRNTKSSLNKTEKGLKKNQDINLVKLDPHTHHSHIEINFFPQAFFFFPVFISINILIHANITASLDYRWMER